MTAIFRQALYSFSNILFPSGCLLCKEYLMPQEQIICHKCFLQLPFVSDGHHEGINLTDKFTGRIPVRHCYGFLYYNKGGIAQQLLQELKYHHNRKVGTVLGKAFGAQLKQAVLPDIPDYIVPVPLHPRKRLIRGYNQSEIIARGIASQTGIPVLNKLVGRIRYTETQTKKSRQERIDNVAGIFLLKKKAEDYRDRHFLLIDDVLTTGATMESCARQILMIPGATVSVAAVAIPWE